MKGSVLGMGMRIRENQRTQTSEMTPTITAMILEPVKCPPGGSINITKHGKTAEGKRRYKCRNSECTRHSFVLEYSYHGYLPTVKQQICDMAMNGSGIRDTARVLKISPTTVIEELKKRTSP